MQTVGPETSFKPGLMEIACNAMEIAAKQTLCEDEASLAAGLEAGLEAMAGREAMEIATHPMESALG